MEKNSRWIYYLPIAVTYALHWAVFAALTIYENSLHHRLIAIAGFGINGLTGLFTATLAGLFGTTSGSPNLIAWAIVTLVYYVVFYLPLLGFCTTKERNNKFFFAFLQVIFIGMHLTATIQLLGETELLLK